MKEFRVGIIGFGFIGKVHAYGHLNIPLFYDNCDFRSKITHVCTSRQATADKAANLLGAANAVTDFREITENPDIDIVDIASPNNLHCDELLSAMAHGKHIYCDKPLTGTIEEAQRIEAALPAYRGISQMTLNYRFYSVVLRAKQMMDAGLIGDVLEFRGTYLHSSNVNPATPLKWKMSGAAGGGVVADLGSHIMDVIEYLCGPIAELTATTRIAYPQRPSVADPSRMVDVDAEDNMHVIARLKSGATGTITATKIATSAEDELGFEIFGTKGSLKMVGGDLHHLFYYNNEAVSSPIGGVRGWTAIDCGGRYEAPAGGFPSFKAPIGWLRGHMHCLYNFLDAVNNGRYVQPDLARGIEVQRLIEAVKQSASSRKWVTL